MADEGFLRRWARRKSEVREGREPEPAPVAEAPLDAAGFAAPAAVPVQAPLEGAAEAQPLPAEHTLPTMDDVAALDADSDFSGFVARGVDQAVRRSALKKLFADPHFKVMDRLDVYIDDYTKASPMSEAMLASLNHAKSAFMKMVEDEPAEPQPEQPPEQETQ
ncbi:hypothetical protein SRABI118_01122 [Massilia sp. Bi118]|uniref:DUF3306 domain-containing protein n=1 Tax=Massilia sp. Bi118 TaxID=2822346 RepID=UPI001DB6953C|nr:DUF3306 domain-containing protein [Massilia sp. Bi118]CAH0176354.1 hypothetical protein SRABI118_01122 [Massilia sp. Bi118]